MATERVNARGTRWFGESLPIHGQQPSSRVGSGLLSTQVPLNTGLLQRFNSAKSTVAVQITQQDPWQLYEPWGILFFDRNWIVARHRQSPSDLVNIQVLTMEPSVAHSLVQTINQCSHHSFPRLLNVLQHENRYYLVWEPVEFSLSEVLASECYITEAELAQLIWPILKGIRYLRNQGRLLATLTSRDVLVSESGGVKIGIEKSLEIGTAKPSTKSLQLEALASIMGRLMQKYQPGLSWSRDAHDFLAELVKSYSEGRLDELLQHPFFRQMEGEGGLKILIKIVDKTAYHELNPLSQEALASRAT